MLVVTFFIERTNLWRNYQYGPFRVLSNTFKETDSTVVLTYGILTPFLGENQGTLALTI